MLRLLKIMYIITLFFKEKKKIVGTTFCGLTQISISEFFFYFKLSSLQKTNKTKFQINDNLSQIHFWKMFRSNIESFRTFLF